LAKSADSLFEESCGRSLEQFVYGGEVAATGAFPFMAAFVHLLGGKEIGRGDFYLEIKFELFITPSPPPFLTNTKPLISLMHRSNLQYDCYKDFYTILIAI